MAHSHYGTGHFGSKHFGSGHFVLPLLEGANLHYQSGHFASNYFDNLHFRLESPDIPPEDVNFHYGSEHFGEAHFGTYHFRWPVEVIPGPDPEPEPTPTTKPGGGDFTIRSKKRAVKAEYFGTLTKEDIENITIAILASGILDS